MTTGNTWAAVQTASGDQVVLKVTTRAPSRSKRRSGLRSATTAAGRSTRGTGARAGCVAARAVPSRRRFVQVINDRFHMWYIFGTGWRRYESDGFRAHLQDRRTRSRMTASLGRRGWPRIIADRLGPDECQALPTVVESPAVTTCSSATDRRRLPRTPRRVLQDRPRLVRRLGELDARRRATANRRWPHGGWDSEMLCYPNAFASRRPSLPALQRQCLRALRLRGGGAGMIPERCRRSPQRWPRRTRFCEHLVARASSSSFRRSAQRVDLETYARKIRAHALTVEAWELGDARGTSRGVLRRRCPIDRATSRASACCPPARGSGVATTTNAGRSCACVDRAWRASYARSRSPSGAAAARFASTRRPGFVLDQDAEGYRRASARSTQQRTG